MIKTFRFALLACGLVGGALTATAAPAVPVRVATCSAAFCIARKSEKFCTMGRDENAQCKNIREGSK